MKKTTLFMSTPLSGTHLHLSKEKQHHLIHVLRLKPKQMLRLVFEHSPHICTAKIEKITKSYIQLSQLRYEPVKAKPYNITLAQCLPKQDKMRDILSSCTALGISTFQPIVSQFCEQKAISEHKWARWQTCILRAAEQSHQQALPSLLEATTLYDFVENHSKTYDKLLLCYEDSSLTSHILCNIELPQNSPQKICLVIGPEGGFSEDEIKHCRNTGFSICSLGESTLRTEIAGFSALSMIVGTLDKLANNCVAKI